MTWNYRIMKKYDDMADEYYYSVNEVFYEDGKPTMYSEHDIVTGHTKDEILDVLEMIIKDVKKKQPVLTERDFKNDNS